MHGIDVVSSFGVGESAPVCLIMLLVGPDMFILSYSLIYMEYV